MFVRTVRLLLERLRSFDIKITIAIRARSSVGFVHCASFPMGVTVRVDVLLIAIQMPELN